jgi:hypothetical protein
MEIEQTENRVRPDAGETRMAWSGLPRRWYTHHGIYVGGGRIVQYGGLSWGLRRGPVEEVPQSQFS